MSRNAHRSLNINLQRPWLPRDFRCHWRLVTGDWWTRWTTRWGNNVAIVWEYIWYIYMVILIGIHFVTCKLRGAQDARGAEDAREEGGYYDAYPNVSLSLRMLGTNIAGWKKMKPSDTLQLVSNCMSEFLHFSANETDFSSCRFNLDAETGSAGHNLTTNS